MPVGRKLRRVRPLKERMAVYVIDTIRDNPKTQVSAMKTSLKSLLEDKKFWDAVANIKELLKYTFI